MAGAIDLFSGNDPVAGINLFKVDKSPLDRLDQGIAGMVQQAESAAGAITDLIQAIIDAVLGWAGGTLTDLAEFFLNLGPNFVKLIEGLTGLNIDEGPVAFIQSFFVKLEAATGLNWDEGPVRFLTSLFDAVIGQLERLTGLNFGDGPVGFFNGIFLKLEAATGLDWNSGPLAFLASLFDGIWTQLNIATDLVWDEGPIAFIASVFDKIWETLNELTGLTWDEGPLVWLASVWDKLNEATGLTWDEGPLVFIASFFTKLWATLNSLTGLVWDQGPAAWLLSFWNKLFGATGLVWDQGPIAFINSFFTKLWATLNSLTGLVWDQGPGPWLTSLWVKLEAWTGLNWDEGPIPFITSFFNKMWTELNALTGLTWNAGPISFLNSLVNWVLTNIFSPTAAANIFTTIRTFIAQFFDPTKGPLSGIFLLITAVSNFFFQFFPWLKPAEPASSATALTTASTIADNVPTTRSIVGAITGQTADDDVDIGLGTLQQWARDIEAEAKKAGDSLNGFIQQLLSGQIPVGMLNTGTPNILVQGDFPAAATIESAGGWEWDNTTTATATGGSAKVTATGSLQELYSKQTISVKTADKIAVTAWVRTQDFSSGSAVLSVIPWVGTQRLKVNGTDYTHVVSTRSSATSSFTEMTGLTIKIGGTAAAGEVVIPDTVTSIQVRLAVTANANAKVWFDDINVKKTGLVDQTWVQSLVSAWQQIYKGTTGTTDPVTGRTWEDLFSATSGFRGLFNTEKQLAETQRSKFYGANNIVGDQISDGVIPTLAQTKVTGLSDLNSKVVGAGGLIQRLYGGTSVNANIQKGALPLELRTAAGSGVMLYRKSTELRSALPNRSPILSNYFDTTQVFNSSADIQILNEGVTNSPTALITTQPGWYLVSVGYGLRSGNTWYSAGTGGTSAYNYCWGISPLIYLCPPNGSATAPSVQIRTGTDAVHFWHQSALATTAWSPRYVQSSWIVYLPTPEGLTVVRPGYDFSGHYVTNAFTSESLMLASDDGSDTYFAISLLNRSLL